MSSRSSASAESFESPDVAVSSSIVKDHRPIVSDRKLILEGGDDECFETSSSSAKDNFALLFHKEFDASRQNFDFDSISRKQTDFEVLGGGASQRKFESPLQRFNRLQLDISSFLAEINQIQSESGEDQELEQGVKAAELAKEIASLQLKLTQKFSDNPSSSSSSSFSPLADNQTAAKLLATLQTFKTADSETSSSSSSSSPSSSSSDHAKGDQNGVVYELYYNSRPSDLDPIAVLERKIAALEKAVGQSDPLVSFNKPLSTIVDDMERRLSLLSETKISQLETRIKSAAESIEDSRLRIESEKESKINQINDTITKWDVVATQLPSIVARLQTLRTVHENAVNTVNAVSVITQQQGSIQPILEETQQQISALQESIKSNSSIIENNVKAIEARLQSLESKISSIQG